MRFIDLRSDTVTQPTPEMREAMYRAEVGDDVYGEDPTVRELEEKGAAKLGFPAGLFLASGTMGNLVALLTHTRRGDEVLLEAESHIYYYEVGGMAALAGAQPRLIPGERGIICPEQVRNYYRSKNIHFPNPVLLCLENTHNRGGGSVYSPGEISALIACARDLGLKVHIDGARIFNAAIACGCDPRELVKGADSVQFCLSKGLGAPMGSLLAGSTEFINQARKWRKMVGGGFRQIGIMAAAGLVALEKMIDRLEEDHRKAYRLAEGLAGLPYVRIQPELVKTNILVFELLEERITTSRFLSQLQQAGIKANDSGPSTIRFVTHKDVSNADVDYVLQVLQRVK
ncbi:MAG: threonine aldolase family protein [Bacillota bacterium]